MPPPERTRAHSAPTPAATVEPTAAPLAAAAPDAAAWEAEEAASGKGREEDRESGADSSASSAKTGARRESAALPPPEAVLDPAVLDAAIDAVVEEKGAEAARSRVLEILRNAHDEARATIARTLEAAPFAARGATRLYTHVADSIVRALFRHATEHLFPLTSPTEGQRLALVGVGGYGRGEMAPFSDIDLLFLHPYKLTAWAENVVESMLYMMWDLGLKVGHATRSIPETIHQAQGDHTIRTALLESRPIAGDTALLAEFETRLEQEVFRKDVVEFVEAKLAEREERHRRNGGQRYVLEPNVKEGKGGLRDLQSLFWIAKYIYGVRETRALVPAGLLTEEEFEIFEAASDFLWTVRVHLHLVAGRATEKLTFDRQVEIAERLGYRDRPGRRAVEQFMQDYFRHATRVGDLTRIFLTALEARQLKKAPSLAARLFAGRRQRRLNLPGWADIRSGRLDVADEDAFLAEPLNFLRLFDVALRTGILLHPDAMRLVARHLDLIDDATRQNPEANALFLRILLEHGDPERALRRMNELGLLGAFIPDFERIVSLMQFNMYHHYTVDEHTIQAISQLHRIEKGELKAELPVSTTIVEQGINRRVLYVATLLHDIGKGQEEDHSILGARIAERLAPRLGLDEEESALVVWLVRHHLLMSDVAQKRDLSDPATVREFARTVGSVQRLKLLLLLTVADIRAVGPGTWNAWKAQLLRDLYHATHDALTGGVEQYGLERRIDEARAALAGRLGDWPEEKIARELERHYPPYWQGLSTEEHVTFARLLDGITESEIRLDLTPAPDRGATRVAFALADHPGLFARLAGALALAGANVVEARTYTTSDGYATAAFWVQDASGKPYGKERRARLERILRRILAGEIVAGEALAEKSRLPRRERRFTVPTSVSFDNEGSDLYTIVEIEARDRPGLLHDLARTLANANMRIHSAVIATYGEQAVDSFYVKDLFGLKLTSKERQKKLEERIRQAVERGAAALEEA